LGARKGLQKTLNGLFRGRKSKDRQEVDQRRE
jgi:hypothetical protein